ncbi:oxidoreductase [Tsukamurella pulmonis]|uniref:Ferredoxin-NADP reductase n=1 Tax=Tsukamurella pulmonis TaxID=47312 RepID=A0A1H1HUB2_9ACTN|nr:FAD-binding oxidoreductase [Tsukamurella pulmonis]KXO94362.1 oxidoreductase [Tsukamurella pulmonis]KXP11761.1 oxidoreductase [Tsukamurella pulmonis]RDH12676.1 oxidoreductase [Tsukamurella pulmonis]SDR29041.1 Ferredoxin-NADP reductase [Tsukamurella pulmonis]SUP13114.1 Benzoate 1,2-dioxygenase electron transfer component [Tsukamurella pulmonis]
MSAPSNTVRRTKPPHAGWHRARLVEARPESATSRRLVFDVPTWPGNDAGAHADLRLTAPDGYQATRSYSLASYGPQRRVVLAVAEVPDGEVSPYLVQDLAVGDEVQIQGPLGRYFIWRPDKHEGPVQLIAGGSGVVPLFPMAEANEQAENPNPVRLLYSVRTAQDVMFDAELQALQHTDVRVIHTREDTAERPAGRLTQDEFAELVVPPAESSALYICGPTVFVETVANWATSLGYPAQSIRTERFGGK